MMMYQLQCSGEEIARSTNFDKLFESIPGITVTFINEIKKHWSSHEWAAIMFTWNQKQYRINTIMIEE